jgi:hypothetical protein
MEQANSVYNTADPRLGPQNQAYYKPVDQGEQERIMEAQIAGDDLTDPDLLRTMRPIALPQVPLMPDRLGYGHHVIDVEDCMGLSRDASERYDFSGSQGGYTGTATPSMGVW